MRGLDPYRHASTRRLVADALAEDLGRGDVTTAAVVPVSLVGRARLATRQDAVVAGLPLAALALATLAPEAKFRVVEHARDGDRVGAGGVLATIEGPVGILLGAERVILNLLQHLSGVATLTRQYVDAVAGTGCRIADTRKTLPGLRLLEKHAVRAGGGTNHRFGLDDGILVKDNHVAACGGISEAIRLCRESAHHLLRVEIECDSLEQVREAVAGGADAILLDNMDATQTAEARRIAGPGVLLEASGGVHLETVGALARSGVDLISVGRLTHSVPAVDIGLDLEPRTGA